ncbi:MAG: ABC transporter permease subunit, partial [Actinobacteria bacterium]|nr:ABC transporter permease subunit [Actinomycetota bacterium]
MTRVNLVNNYMGAILIYSLLPIPFSIYLLTSFFKTIPQELIDAARIDGCSSMRVLGNIILPISKPPIIATIAVNGIWVWNDLLIAIIFLQKNQLR